ncbi:MAG: hypothetical protein COY36_02615 [Zetaproteobacteria bacterium CG_4_10_14_0_2_um_filter_55_20]|nr:MAG: hypothetical protein AUJ58_07650 [Zetaproteobacteria bacterium CG1_02_55_237]PIS20070.1 MAG: hypothetical protein COT53_02515 [Zetaproteobacteria bacterium CG08_land_8_20_14_0_20_55_17]PIY52926.1 MAG: hypothetical protein COZ01_05860 [Zetaproteobacteria bacterium CG_4_10_14_0_8_um_filter_55_43]PIZ39531.1 MAG: hypothetical protein COY36_02615 [Zetaproteobacteria bacterium CG_4_10_14_0_2_um_filter_55_20]PJB79923.1 MAG: hypothetical protein CO089_08985 [Zetaproteobacteria bacterium CG_4_9_
MTQLIRALCVFTLLLCTGIPAASAHDASIKSMAGIIMHLNHFPSDSEKHELEAIASDEHVTPGERALAGALLRMQHTVEGEDSAALRALAVDKNASQGERELADILLGIHHHPSVNDQQRLKTLSD